MISTTRKIVVAVSGFVLFTLSSVASAGSIGVVVGPPGSGGGGAAANAVPVMGGPLLAILGAFMAVIALRYLRENRGAQKLMSVLLLGTGLVVGGAGVDRTLATGGSQEVSADSPACSGGTETINSEANDWDQNVTLTNNCASSSVEVKRYISPCDEQNIVHQDAPPGTVIPVGGVVKYSYCPPPV